MESVELVFLDHFECVAKICTSSFLGLGFLFYFTLNDSSLAFIFLFYEANVGKRILRKVEGSKGSQNYQVGKSKLRNTMQVLERRFYEIANQRPRVV